MNLRRVLRPWSTLALCLSLSLLALACGEAEYEPCESKKCGDSCTICDPDDKGCVETAVVKSCDAQGQCVEVTPMCPAS